MSTTPTDWFSRSLPEILLDTEAARLEAEEKTQRTDEAVASFEWLLSRLPAGRSAVLTPNDVLALFAALTIYQTTGRKMDALERAMEMLEEAS